MSIFEPIKVELDRVNMMLNKEYLIKAGHLSSFAHLEYTSLNSTIRPAMVILSSRLFNHMDMRVTSLAAVVQFIYLASTIHSNVNEDNEEDKFEVDPRDGSQFPVLVGDYLYGKFFTSLCNAQIVEFLKPLSHVICAIHEGGILKQKTAHNDTLRWEEIAYKETGFLIETGCRLAANLAEAGNTEENEISCFGRELGIAYGLIENNASYEIIDPYFKKAQNILGRLPQNKYHFILQEFLIRLQENAKVNQWNRVDK